MSQAENVCIPEMSQAENVCIPVCLCVGKEAFNLLFIYY